MADISITQTHSLSLKKARAAAQKVANKLAEEYDMQSEWDGDVLYFQRSGVSGSLTVAEGVAEMEIKLGFLLSAFAPKIEAEVQKNMKKVFSTTKA